MKRRDTIGLEHRAVIGDHREPAVLLPQRERRALDDVDLELAGIELQHRGVGDPGIGLQLVAHGGGIEEQQRGAAIDAADREHLVLAQLLAAVDGDRGDAESGGIGQRIAGVAQRRGEFVEMAALDDAEAGAAEQQQHGRGDAGAARQITLEPARSAGAACSRSRRACLAAGARAKAQPLAQQHDRANGGRFQVSLGPRRSQRSSEASCTIHCTSSSNVVPANTLRVLAQMTSRSCRLGDLGRGLSLDAVVEAEIRNSSRPGSQAPHAPPALTFGLPGKQKVKSVRTGRVLIRFLSSFAAKFVRILAMIRDRFARPDPRAVSGATSARALLPPARSGRCRKSANSIPCAFSAFGYSEAAVRPGKVLVSR